MTVILERNTQTLFLVICSLGTKQLTKFSEQGTLSGLKVVVGSPFLVLLSMLLFQVVIQSYNFCQSLE